MGLCVHRSSRSYGGQRQPAGVCSSHHVGATSRGCGEALLLTEPSHHLIRLLKGTRPYFTCEVLEMASLTVMVKTMDFGDLDRPRSHSQLKYALCGHGQMTFTFLGGCHQQKQGNEGTFGGSELKECLGELGIMLGECGYY